jgi:hypothetical protein
LRSAFGRRQQTLEFEIGTSISGAVFIIPAILLAEVIVAGEPEAEGQTLPTGQLAHLQTAALDVQAEGTVGWHNLSMSYGGEQVLVNVSKIVLGLLALKMYIVARNPIGVHRRWSSCDRSRGRCRDEG